MNFLCNLIITTRVGCLNILWGKNGRRKKQTASVLGVKILIRIWDSNFIRHFRWGPHFQWFDKYYHMAKTSSNSSSEGRKLTLSAKMIYIYIYKCWINNWFTFYFGFLFLLENGLEFPNSVKPLKNNWWSRH